MGDAPGPSLALADARLLRRAFGLARAARDRGNHPFGALVADPAGEIVSEAENAVVLGGGATAHAELLAVSAAARQRAPAALASCTLFTSTEPCAMCAGATYWAGIGRVVFGLEESELLELTGAHAENPTLCLPCRSVFAAGQRPTAVIGPVLREEALALHAGFWY